MLLSLLPQAEKTTLTSVFRVPVVLAEQLLEIAHRLDDVEFLELTQDNGANKPGRSIQLTRDNLAEDSSQSIELTQDKITDESRLKAKHLEVIALLQSAVTPKSKGGSDAANNATGIKRLVEQALALLGSEIH